MSNLLNKAALPLPNPGQVTHPTWARPRLVRPTSVSPSNLKLQAALALADQKQVIQ